MERGLHLLLLRDVPKNLRSAYYLSTLIFDRGDSERNIDVISIFLDAHRLKVLKPFAGPYLRQNQSLVAQEFWRNDQRDRPADNLFRLIAKDTFRALVPSSHD